MQPTTNNNEYTVYHERALSSKYSHQLTTTTITTITSSSGNKNRIGAERPLRENPCDNVSMWCREGCLSMDNVQRNSQMRQRGQKN